MKLHANAALSLNKRRLLVHRVVEGGWSLAKAALAAEVSEPTARKWLARYLSEGRLAYSTALRPPTTSTTAPRRTASR